MRAADVSGRATSCATPSTSAPARGWSASRGARRGSSGPGSGSSAEAHADDVEFNINILPWGSLPLQIAVAAGVATFWRGAWYVMDTSIFPDDNLKSGAACLVAGTAGLAKLQRYAASEVHKRYIAKNIPPPPSLRYGLLYGMGLSCVAVWRGTWCKWDSLFECFDPWAFKGDAGVRNGEDEESSSPGEP